MAAPPETAPPETVNPTTPANESIRLAGIADTASPKDELGFRPYVDAVAAYLAAKNTTGPLTISVEGPCPSASTRPRTDDARRSSA